MPMPESELAKSPTTSETTEAVDVVNVGQFKVAALSRQDLIELMVNWPVASGPALMYHLHVGALNERADAEFVDAMNRSSITYADGMATVLVAKAGGAKAIERAGLTDIGHEVIQGVAKRLGRPAQIAYLGGPEGLAERAGEKLAELHDCVMVYSTDGFHDDVGWKEVLSQARESEPDIVFVGLGMPREAFWTQQFFHDLPPALIMAAGGFFGHVVGDEKRAPEWAQKVGMEWLWRVGQSPTRLASRYAKGLLSTSILAIDAYRNRP